MFGAQCFLIDHHVNAPIAGAFDALSALLGTAITHARQQPDDGFLEQSGVAVTEQHQQGVTNLGRDAVDAGLDLFDRAPASDVAFWDKTAVRVFCTWNRKVRKRDCNKKLFIAPALSANHVRLASVLG
ncbi:hypothetical protein RCG67_05450 [Kocuria sp. CPCC 205292]